MAVRFAPQNISVQNKRKWCIRSHAHPLSLVPFDPSVANIKSMSRFSEVWREAFPGWWWSACCQNWRAEQQSRLQSSFFARSQLWISGGQLRGPSPGAYSGQTQGRQHPRTRFFRKNCLLFPASFKSRRTTKQRNEDRRCGEDPTDDGVVTCLRRQLSWTARRWRWRPPSPSLASAVASAPEGRTDPQCRPSPSRSASTHLQRSRWGKKEQLTLGVVYISVFFVFTFHPGRFLRGEGACTALLKKSRWSLILRFGVLWCKKKHRPRSKQPSVTTSVLTISEM